jgi:hypothetical protein
MRNSQQSDAVFIVGHDARHALGGWAVFGRIELGFASRDRSCVLGLQQLRKEARLKTTRPLESGNLNLPG